jgi:adenylate cyclase
MTPHNADPLTHIPAKRLRFDRFVLDLDRGCLLLDGSEILLRPKTFAVLHHLIENCGRLVSKDELFAAVWPNLAVTDDTLVQSVGELRRALGTDGAHLIRTVPRRGYRFEADVSDVSSIGRSPADAEIVSALPGVPVDLPAPFTTARTPGIIFATTRAGARFGLVALLILASLLAAGVLWGGVGTGSKTATLPETANRATTKRSDIATKPEIAILPFLNLSGDPAREYFADGLTQDIINALGRFSGLTVMSWNAVLPYKGKPASPGEIARGLAVRYQVEGSVRQTGNRVRVIAQLVDTTGRVLWSASFDEALANVLTMQDKITAEIVRTLAVRVTQIEQRRVYAKPTQSLEAYDYVLRARPALQRPARGSIVEARALLRRAIQLDPNYAAAYSALAETYYVSVSMGWAESPTASLGCAEEMANKALEQDTTDVRARIVLGRIEIFYHRYERAMVELDRAVAVNPNDAHGIAGRGNILMWSGQTDAAIAALELAQRIDPDLNSMDSFALSLAYYLKRQYDAAIEQATLNLRETTGANFSRIVLAAAYGEQNRSEDAARAVAMVRRLDPTFDPQAFGSKFLNPIDLEHLRDGFRKAGLYLAGAGIPLPRKDR